MNRDNLLSNSCDEIIDDKTDGGDNVDKTDKTELDLKVYCNDTLVNPNDTISLTNTKVFFKVESNKEYKASYVVYSDYQSFDYKVNESYMRFKPSLDCLEKSVDGNVYSLQFPIDIMSWILQMHAEDAVTAEQVTIPTDVNFNVPYVAFVVEVEDITYTYPIQFNLNGIYSKLHFEQDEVLFLD